LWSETIKGGEMIEYYLLPKLIAFSERCWAKPSEWEVAAEKYIRKKLMDKEWDQFKYTIYNQELPKLNFLNGGYTYRIPPAGVIIKDDDIKADAICRDLIIRYTLNGSDPEINSPIYTSPLSVKGQIKFRVFDKAGNAGRITTIEN
jgi:hexosaminidase